MQLNEKEILKELIFKTCRSGGKGGQHINKVSTKVGLMFHVAYSKSLSDEQKRIISEKLAPKINTDGFIHIISQTSRSQYENKKIAIAKFFKILRSALAVKKARKATKPSALAVDKRLKNKKLAGEIKKLRAKVRIN